MTKTGNKGEWSELYALLRLLADGKIKTTVADDCWIPVLQVIREDSESFKLEFRRSQKNFVELYSNNDRVCTLKTDDLADMATKILDGINGGGDSAFEIDGAAKIMDALSLTKIKSPANRKADIEVKIHDPFTAYDRICCYSIKSDIGQPPTLLNASRATNFRFKLPDMNAALMESVNKLPLKQRLEKLGGIEFDSINNETFAGNLDFIDTQFDKIVAEMLKIYYGKGIANCTELATKLEDDNPLKFRNTKLYRHKIKKFLCAVALGLRPAKVWNGRDEADGGYIIVKESGDIVAYNLYNRDEFESYLLNNTRLETASTGRHKFGTVCTTGGVTLSISTCKFVSGTIRARRENSQSMHCSLQLYSRVI